MHDLKDKLLGAGVPEPNRADRRKAEALERLGQMREGEAVHREIEGELESGKPLDDAVATVLERRVERTSKGIRTVRCGPPRK